MKLFWENSLFFICFIPLAFDLMHTWNFYESPFYLSGRFIFFLHCISVLGLEATSQMFFSPYNIFLTDCWSSILMVLFLKQSLFPVRFFCWMQLCVTVTVNTHRSPSPSSHLHRDKKGSLHACVCACFKLPLYPCQLERIVAACLLFLLCVCVCVRECMLFSQTMFAMLVHFFYIEECVRMRVCACMCVCKSLQALSGILLFSNHHPSVCYLSKLKAPVVF